MPKKEIQKNKTEEKKSVKETENFIRAVGRGKRAVARVRLYPKGKGNLEVNKMDYKKYFSYFELNQKLTAPLKLVGKRNAFDFTIKVKGGGRSGQAEACRLGIARALVKFNQDDYKKVFRAAGFLTRDSRVKERKKPGLKKARRAPQWSKR